MLTLKDFGANSPIRLIGVQGEGSLPFSVRRDEVADRRQDRPDVRLFAGVDPGTQPSDGADERRGRRHHPAAQGQVLRRYRGAADSTRCCSRQDNRLLFRFIGHYTLGCEDPLHSSLWLVLSNMTHDHHTAAEAAVAQRSVAAAGAVLRSEGHEGFEPALCLCLEGLDLDLAGGGNRRVMVRRASPRTRERPSRPASIRFPTPTPWYSRQLTRSRRGLTLPRHHRPDDLGGDQPQQSRGQAAAGARAQRRRVARGGRTLTLGRAGAERRDAGRRRSRYPGRAKPMTRRAGFRSTGRSTSASWCSRPICRATAWSPGLLTLEFPYRARPVRLGQYRHPARHPLSLSGRHLDEFPRVRGSTCRSTTPTCAACR